MFKKILFLFDYSQKKAAFILFFLLLIGMLLEVAGVGIVIPIVSLLFDQDNDLVAKIFLILSHFGIHDYYNVIIFVLFLFIIFFLIKSIFMTVLSWVQIRFVYDLKVSISNKLFNKYLSQKYSFHLNRNSSEYIRNINNEVDTLSGTVNFLLILISELLITFGILIFLSILEPKITISVILVFAFFGGAFYYLIRNKSLNWGKKRQYFDGKKIQSLQQAFGGIKEIKLHNKESTFFQFFSEFNFGSSNMSRNQSFISTFPRFWLEFIVIICFFLIVYFLKISGEEIQSITPTLAIFGAAAFKVYPSTNKILNSAQMIKYNVPVINLIYKEMNLQDLVKDSNNNELNKIIFKKNISININSFRYSDSGNKVLKDVKFEILKGSALGIIGHSGAGKSTLIDIILGLLKSNVELVNVDGLNIHKNIISWQKQIGYVPQSIYLMDDTLKKNIAFGIKETEIKNERLHNSLELSQLSKIIPSLEKGLETFIGENGIRLSGGQRQRIGIARALYSNPEILVLDESTSSLDYKTEKEILDSIKNLKGLVTSIIISHRVDNLKFCDNVLVLENGQIIFIGPFEELPEKYKSS